MVGYLRFFHCCCVCLTDELLTEKRATLGFVAQFDMFVTKLKLSDNPKEKAGLFNRLTFFYLDGLFRLGSKRPLVEEDLHEPIQCDKAAAVCPRLEAAWNEELTKKLGICI